MTEWPIMPIQICTFDNRKVSEIMVQELSNALPCQEEMSL